MNTLANNISYWQAFFFNYGMLIGRYLIFAGGAFFIFYVLKPQRFLHIRIQAKFPSNSDYRREILYSLSTFLIFALMSLVVLWARRQGYTQIYTRISDYGWPYLLFSIVAYVVLHDTYFYWTHRLMHWKAIFPYVHKVHHLSTNPSP